MGVQPDNSLVSLRCSLCMETYKQPHILACLHSFCYQCIEKLGQTEDKESSIKCPCCKQESNMTEGTVRPNYFFTNTLAASILKEIQSGEIYCGNCTKNISPSVFCEECEEYLCIECGYCHENTKLTRSHRLLPKEEYEAHLTVSGHERAVYCAVHTENTVREYCRTCQETTCLNCESHSGHTVVALAEAYAMETPVLKDVLHKAAAKVDSHEKCASRCCTIVDELRACKGELSERIKTYFAVYRERIQKDEEKLQEMVLEWYDKKFQMIRQAQKEEEQRAEKVVNALKLSQVVLKHGTDVEILSLTNLIQSQLNRVANQSTGEKLITAIEAAIRNASWDSSTDHDQDECLQEGLRLPEVHHGQLDNQNDEKTSAEEIATEQKLTGDWVVLDEKSFNEENELNAQVEFGNGAWLALKKVGGKRQGSCGVEGQDYHIGSVIPGEKSRVWQRLRRALTGGTKHEVLETERDYRYDKIMRNKNIGRQGSGCGEFKHPCDVAVDCQSDDRLIVTDNNNHRVQVFSYFGDFLFAFGSRGSKPGQFMGPTGVAVLHDSSIVVCDCLNNRVQLFTRRGVYTSSFGREGRSHGRFWRPMGVAVDSQDRIIVVDQGNNRVQVFDSNGDFCFTFGKLGHWDGQVSCPNFVAVDKDDNIYVSDEVNMRIQIFDRHGVYLRKVTSHEIHGFRGNMKLLSGIAVDSRGYIVVSGKNSCSVQVFTPDGRFLRSFSSKRMSLQSRLQFAAGVALTSAGEIVVCDWLNNRIRFF